LRKHWKQFDLLHDESGSFWPFAAQCKLPVLATLHLPRPCDGENSLRNTAYNGYFNSVSPTQARSFQDIPNLLGVVQNGIAVEQFPLTTRKQNYLLWMGRICEEKAPHLAIAAAKQAGLPILLAGQVYPFRSHQSYFDREIRPHLANDPEAVQFVETPSFRQKLKLLSEARALLLTSTAEETSSLVAMEAMACGTPVIAFRRGAFSEIVSEAETGFLTDTVNEMSKAIVRSGEISSAACRARVERHFTAARMASEYEWLYREVLTRSSMSLAA
jgi:glycosyltransferase involved in cell wall biosynthesis